MSKMGDFYARKDEEHWLYIATLLEFRLSFWENVRKSRNYGELLLYSHAHSFVYLPFRITCAHVSVQIVSGLVQICCLRSIVLMLSILLSGVRKFLLLEICIFISFKYACSPKSVGSFHVACMSESPNVPVVIFSYQAKVSTKPRGCHEV